MLVSYVEHGSLYLKGNVFVQAQLTGEYMSFWHHFIATRKQQASLGPKLV
jgi:hypothetical protein